MSNAKHAPKRKRGAKAVSQTHDSISRLPQSDRLVCSATKEPDGVYSTPRH